MNIDTIPASLLVESNRQDRRFPLLTFLFKAILLLSVLLPFLLSGTVSFAAEVSSNTLFIPLKINTASDSEGLTKDTDNNLREISEKYHFQTITRIDAEKRLDYGTWPPDFAAIQAIPTGVTTDYVALGSVTRTGDKVSIDVTVYDLLDENAVKFFYQEGRAATGFNHLFESIAKKVISYTNRQSIVGQISVTGNKKIDSGAINQKILVEVGDPYDTKKLKKSLREIYKMGYFSDIKIKVSEDENGRNIIFEVTEKAVIGQIQVEGDKELDTDEILGVIELTPNNIISNRDIQDSITSIKELYKEEGYYNTTVTSEQNYPQEGRVDIKFIIDEGSKVFIKDITISGNKSFSTKKLLKVIETSKKGWFSWITESGLLDHDLIEQDAARIAAFYHNKGFIEAKIGQPEVTQKGDWFHVNFTVEEGARYRVGTLDLTGDLLEKKGDIVALTKIVRQKYFSQKVLRGDILKITDLYAEKGYAFAEAQPKTIRDEKNKRINVVIDIKQNELIHINRIVIRGNSRTRDKVIRREMKIKETGLFNATAIKQSQRNLQRLGFFEDVQIVPEPASQTDMMDIIVKIKEKPTGNFSIGAGYSSVDSFMFMSELSQDNFLGKGQNVALKANLSKTSTQYNLSFTEPHLADSNLLAGIDIYDWTKEYDEYDKDSQGIGLRFGYPLGWKWDMFGSYSFDDTVLTDISPTASQKIKDSTKINITSAVKVGFTRDTRDRFTDASKGTLFKIITKYAGGPLGGDAQFTKFDVAAHHYQPLPWEATLHNKLAGGWAVENEGDKLPVFEKYYLGGINSIRGFKSGSISPRASNDEKIGGGKMWYYNLECIFPMVKDVGLKGVVFFDAGNVYDVNESWDFGDIKKSVGFGFRWLSPMGPLRLEWGYNLDRKGSETQDNWDFSMGGSF